MIKKIFREFKQAWSGYGVPYVPTSDEKLAIFLDTLELKKGDTFVDIGCGDGRVLEAVSEKFPGVQCIGYETSSYPFSLAKNRQNISKQDFKIHNINIFSASLEEADSIYIYMLPYMLPKLVKKIVRECRPGTRIYIKTHKLKTWEPERVVPLSEKNNLYVYIKK